MTFGQSLKQLLTISNLKSSTLAYELGYDTSYISRWINDIKTPSVKNNEDLMRRIASVITSNTGDSGRKKLTEFCCPGTDFLSEEDMTSAVENLLSSSIAQTTFNAEKSSSPNNSKLSPQISFMESSSEIAETVRQCFSEKKTDVEFFSNLALSRNFSEYKSFWQLFTSRNEQDDVKIQVFQQIDRKELMLHTDECCSAILSFAKFSDNIHFSYYISNDSSSYPNIGTILIENKYLYYELRNTFTQTEYGLICRDQSIIGSEWSRAITNLQKCDQIFTEYPNRAVNNKHFFFDYAIGGTLRYFLNVMHTVYMTGELFEKLLQTWLPAITQEEHDFLLDYNKVCAEKKRDVVIYRSALLEYIYLGKIYLFSGITVIDSQEFRREHVKQIIRNIEDGKTSLTIVDDNNPLLSYSNVHISMYLNGFKGFITSVRFPDSVLMMNNTGTVGCFNTFFEHLQNLGNSYAISGYEAKQFLSDCLDLMQ